MKKFARCILILILVAILSGVGGYIYENNTITPMYESVAKLYVVPGSQNEASIRAKNGGLNHDFTIIFSSKVVIESAQRLAGTSEDISEYLTVSSPADSNIVELKIVNPDQNTAKTYVDAIAKTAVKTTTIIPVESMQILSEGTSDGVATKPHLYYYTALIMGAACVVCVFIELVVCLILCAFKKKEDHSDDEFEYEARFGKYAYPRREYIETEADSTKRIAHDNQRKASSDDILASFDDEDDDEYDDSFLYQSSARNNANVSEPEKKPETPVMKYEEPVSEAIKEAAVAKEEYKPEPVVEAAPEEKEPVLEKTEVKEPEPVEEEDPVKKLEPEIEKPEIKEPEPVEEAAPVQQTEPTLVDEEPAQIVVDTPVEEPVVEEEQPAAEEAEPEAEEQPEEEAAPVVEATPAAEEQPIEEAEPVIEAPIAEEAEPVVEEPMAEEAAPEQEEQPEAETEPEVEEPVAEEEQPVAEEAAPEQEEKPEVEEPVAEEEQPVVTEPASRVKILGRIYK